MQVLANIHGLADMWFVLRQVEPTKAVHFKGQMPKSPYEISDGAAEPDLTANGLVQATPTVSDKRERFRRAMSRKISKNKVVVSTEPLTPGPGEVLLQPQVMPATMSPSFG